MAWLGPPSTDGARGQRRWVEAHWNEAIEVGEEEESSLTVLGSIVVPRAAITKYGNNIQRSRLGWMDG